MTDPRPSRYVAPVSSNLGELVKRARFRDGEVLAQIQARALHEDPEALWILGYISEYRLDGDPETPGAVADYYRRAAKGGYQTAQYHLAEHLETRSLLPRAEAEAEARHWYQVAAEQDIWDSAIRLARMLEEGRGGEKDIDGAIFWYRHAMTLNQRDAAARLAFLYMRLPAYRDDHALVISLLEQAAAELDPHVHYELGEIYRTGRGIAADPERACFHYCIASQQFPKGRDQRASEEQMRALLPLVAGGSPEIERRTREYIDRIEDAE